MGFNPTDKKIDPIIWKPNSKLSKLAKSRCDWVNCDQVNAINDPEEWLGTIIVGCYYQGLADGVKHMARKQREVLNK